MRLMFQLTWTLPIILACAGFSSAGNLTVLYQWKYIDYVWEDDAHKEAAIECGQYDHTKIITNDVQQLPDGRVLVTTPKYYDNPASLSVISDKQGEGGPLLEPYPDWSYHEKDDCSEITSVSRMRVDKCNRLWVIDSGKIGNEQVCPATILVFDATEDEVLVKVELPEELTHNPNDPSKGKLEIQVVETVGDNCEETWAYIGDPEGSGLVIYDGSHVWRLDDDVYAPKDEESSFSIGGENITLENGVASLLLPPPGFIEEDYLFFKPMASLKGYAASREQLHDSHSEDEEVTYYMSNYTLPSQVLAGDFSSDGVMIVGFPTETAIACWYLGNTLEEPNMEILATNAENLQFISGLKITEGTQCEVEGENLWVMSNRYQQFISGTMNFTVDNFYILGANIATLVEGTHCQPGSPSIVDTIEDKLFFEL